MYFKAELLIGGSTYSISNCIANWDDIKAKLSRNNLDSINRTITTNYEFVKEARALINSEYALNAFSSNATIVFKKRNNSRDYDEVFRCRLDFSTYKDDGYIVTLSSIDDNLQAIIKSKGSTEYEFDAMSLTNMVGGLTYDGIEIEQNVSWTIAGDSTDDGDVVTFTRGNNNLSLPLYIIKNETLYNNKVEVQDQEMFEGLIDFAEQEEIKFIVAKEDVIVPVHINLQFKVSGSPNEAELALGIIRHSQSLGYYIDVVKRWNANSEYVTVNETVQVSMIKGDHLILFWSNTYNTAPGTLTIKNSDNPISIKLEDRLKTPVWINVIAPHNFGTALLKSMTGDSNISCSIETSSDPRFQTLFLFPAELIRGIPNAKIYSSFNKFRDWLSSVFGYTYAIENGNVVFRHRTAFFGDNVVKTIDKYNNFELSVNKSLLYASVTGGYEKQEYETVNGRDEFHFSETFTTGLTLNESSLSLISPYRADCYGFELLVHKRGADTTDNGSDKTIFFMKCVQNPATTIIGDYIPDRFTTINSGVNSPTTLFNAMFSPRRSILSNIDLISACATALNTTLTFASSEGNSEIVIEEVSEKADIPLITAGRKLLAQNIKFETPDNDMPGNWSGIIELERNGNVYRGYIDSASFNLAKPDSAEYNLIQRE
jgi:hypothetical protein